MAMWILKNGEPVATSNVVDWMASFSGVARVIDLEVFSDGARVSTVMLAETQTDCPMWQTMILDPSVADDNEEEWPSYDYTSREDAVVGHAEVVARCKARRGLP